MLKKVLQNLTLFLRPRSTFTEDEWILKYQITSMLIFSFFFGIGVFVFAIFRFLEQNYIVASSQFLFAIFSLYGFISLRKDKILYQYYSILFFIIFFIYTGIIFFLVPQNSLNILWVISAPILIFFFLNKKGGIAMFLLVFGFILYLIISKYHYTPAEFITLLAAFFVTTFMMYMYEKVKEKEKIRLLNYNETLKKEVDKQTKKLHELNHTLELRVQKEVEKQQAQEQMLLCQNRMANMGMMIDAIAHQWKQPLMHINSILMNISRMTETQPNNIEYIDNKIDNIFIITEQMSQTINDFRNLFKAEKKKVHFNIETLLNSILTLMKDSLYNININIIIEGSIYLNSYQNELSQVILTILNNAMEAMESNNTLKKEILIHIFENQEQLKLEISDNGGGIQHDNLLDIFKPYVSTKKHLSGTGLGLYIAKIIIERSIHGNISAHNIKNGAKFIISIPKT